VLHRRAPKRQRECILRAFSRGWFRLILDWLELTTLLDDLGIDMQVAMDLLDAFEVDFGCVLLNGLAA